MLCAFCSATERSSSSSSSVGLGINALPLSALAPPARCRSTRARIFAKAVSRRRGRVVAERREAAVVGRAELLERDVLRRLEHAVAHLLGRLDARVDRRDTPTKTR